MFPQLDKVCGFIKTLTHKNICACHLNWGHEINGAFRDYAFDKQLRGNGTVCRGRDAAVGAVPAAFFVCQRHNPTFFGKKYGHRQFFNLTFAKSEPQKGFSRFEITKSGFDIPLSGLEKPLSDLQKGLSKVELVMSVSCFADGVSDLITLKAARKSPGPSSVKRAEARAAGFWTDLWCRPKSIDDADDHQLFFNWRQ